jgi:hypothetical protein
VVFAGPPARPCQGGTPGECCTRAYSVMPPHVVDAFPMTVTGKIQKFKMRQAAIAELGLERAAAVPTA